MGVNLRVRSCRFMPPEDYSEYGSPRISQFAARGARSYSAVSRRFENASGVGHRNRGTGPMRSLRSFLSRLGLLR